jgi:hypothetical protein
MQGLMIGDAPTEPTPKDPGFMIPSPTGGMQVDPSKVDPSKVDPSKVEAPKGDAPKGDTPQGETRPEGLPDGFKSVADLAKSYSELRKEFTKAKQSGGSTDEVTLASAAEEFLRTEGALSDTTKAALTKKGLSVDEVETYVAGQQARSAQVRSDFAKIAGGDDKIAPVLTWAATNLAAEEAKAYEDAITSGNVPLAKMLFQNIVSKHTAAVGSNPTLVTGATVPSGGGLPPFDNWSQVTAEMSKPEYKTDQAFRDKIAKRLAISTKLG